MRIPVLDLSECTDCEGCLSMAPQVFFRSGVGQIMVADLAEYPEEDVDEAIKNCPCGCISWEESG
ncbi:MAG: ferredoxin [Proteobacteria bacterium]|nr:ferredoxin [Pseudomonadota bacterium]